SMLEVEVLVAPFLEPRIERRIMAITSSLKRSMEMNGVVAVWIVWRQIRSAAEPRGVTLLEIPEVGMNRGDHRALRMQHQRNAGGEKCSAVSHWNLGSKLFG